MKNKRHGITIVELLIATSIMVILFAAMIPFVRSISDDARTVNGANMLASAISDAAATSVTANAIKNLGDSSFVEGNAVILERNPNFVDEDGILFGVTKIRRGKVRLRLDRPERDSDSIELVRTCYFKKFTPPITELLAPGTEVEFEGQTVSIVEFVYST